MTKFTSKVKMPEPAHRGPTGTGTYFDSYSKQQMEEYANERVKEALKEAVKICEFMPNPKATISQPAYAFFHADQIRAIIPNDTE